MKIDVDECPDTAAAQGVRAMPTFIFYRNKNKIDSMQVSQKLATIAGQCQTVAQSVPVL